MRYSKYKKRLNGFTLLEVVLAIAIFGILMASFMPLLDSSIKMNAKSVSLLEDAIKASSGLDAIKQAETFFHDNIIVEKENGINYVHMPSKIPGVDGKPEATVDWLSDPNITDGDQIRKELPVFLVQKINGVIFYFYIPYHPFRCSNDPDGKECPTCVITIKIPQPDGETTPPDPETPTIG